MTALPVQMIDRWQHRADPALGEGNVYWHMPMHHHPQVIDLARVARQRLARFGGPHMTPLDRLHIDHHGRRASRQLPSDQLAGMAATATDLLSSMPPVTVTLGRIYYHPEAIMLGVSPAKALVPIRNAALAAARLVTGRDNFPDDPEPWVPHITLCYSTAHQPAAPLIAALGESLPRCQVQISALSLIVQNGPERRWDWSTIATIRLTGREAVRSISRDRDLEIGT
jgi:2'-5' RNA ligase